MTTWLTQWGSVFVTLVVILDPPVAVPIFLAVTAPLTPRQRVAAARRASLVAFGLIAAFAVFGQQILNYLHISIAALQGSGGLLLLLIALELLTAKEQEQYSATAANVALVPLGTPLLATMLAVQGAREPLDHLAVAAGLVTAMAVVWLTLRFAGRIRGVLRESGTMLVTRIAGLLLSAIAVQMVADSIRAFGSGQG